MVSKKLPNGKFSWDRRVPFAKFVHVYRESLEGGKIMEECKMVNTFPVWKFRLGILDYLSRNPVFSGNFPFGKTKIGLPFTFQPKFPDLFGKW